MSRPPVWVHPALAQTAPRPRRKVHLDFHNSQYVPRVGDDFDADEFIATLRAADIDSIVVFAKDMHGYFYYSSEYGPVHPGLDRELMVEQVEACQAAGIKVYVYYCVTWDHYLAEAHPEWLSFTRERESYLPKFDGTPHWTALCLSNDDFVELMLSHTREILQRVTPDGIWYDMPMPNPQMECFCRNCLTALREAGENPLDIEAQRRRMQQLEISWLRRSKQFIDEIAPGVELEQNNQTRLGLADRAEYLYNVDIEALPSAEWGWGYFPVNARYVRSLGLPSTGMTGRFHESWADFGGLKTPRQLTLEAGWIAATGSNVVVGDQAPPSGRLDPAVYRTIGSAYRSLAEVDEHLEGAVGAAEAAVYVDGLQLADFALVERHGNHALAAGVRGATKLLQECGVQFDVVETGTVELDRYRLVVLAEGADLAPAAVAELSAFLARGGTLIHSALPGGDLDDAPWLRDLGVQRIARSPFQPAYVRVTEELGDTLDDFDFALYDGADRWTVSPEVRGGAVLGEPLFQRGPEHYTSHRQSPVATLTGHPAILLGDRVAAFSFPVATGYQLHGYWIYAELFRRVLDAVYPDRLVLARKPRSLEFGVTHQAASEGHAQRWILHAVNFAGATRRGGDHADYYNEEVPVRDIEVSLGLTGIARAYDARTGAELALRVDGDRVLTTLPEVDLHGVFVFEVRE